MTDEKQSLEGSHPLITKGRDTGNGYYLSSRKYPTGDVELVAVKLNCEDSIRRGGGAKRSNSSKDQMNEAVLKKSIQRARTTIRRKLLSMQADRMLTLTFRENVKEIDDAWKCFKYFTRLMRWRFGSRFTYVAVPEYQRRGAVHFHLAISGYYPVTTVRRLWHRAVGKYDGNIDITSPRRAGKNSWNAKRIANYLAKYLTKSESTEFNRKRYSSGGDILIPPVMNGWLALGAPTVSILWEAVSSLTHKPVREFWESEGYFDIIFIST
jgi:hypothetical protein